VPYGGCKASPYGRHRQFKNFGLSLKNWSSKIIFSLRSLPWSARLYYGLALLLLAGSGIATKAFAQQDQAVLQCRVEQGGETFVFQAQPVQNPYLAPTLDINGRFRFKMVVVGSGQAVDYIKIYAFDNPRRQPVLVQYAHYAKPQFSTGNNPAALTGVQTVYSPRLEREMQYQCALYERAP